MAILRRVEGSGGQGLVEAMAVIGLFGAIVAIALPSYLSFQVRRGDERARANLLAATAVADAYRADHGSYRGLDALDLVRIDPRVSPTLTVAFARRGRYCLTDTVDGRTWSIAGPVKREPRYFASADCR
ncbi:MAG TPA: hypothetical protein VNJ53_12130 [Gaiellaceae bacterium]|nr:hypothetical protein [Gaiellaceae bacterium]